MKLHSILVCVGLALVPACSKGGDDADKMVTMMEQMGNAVEAAGGDCGKMADGVSAVMDKYDLAALKASAEKMKSDKAKAEEMMKKYGDRMTKVMPKLMGMMKCSDDPKMKAVEAKFKDFM